MFFIEMDFILRLTGDKGALVETRGREDEFLSGAMTWGMHTMSPFFLTE